MAVIYDYFAAASDEVAATVVDRVGGPGSQAAVVAQPEEPKRGIFGRRRAPAAPTIGSDPGLPDFDTVPGDGVDPVVQLGTLEELLTGRPYDEVVADPRSGQQVAMHDGGARLVLTLTDPLSSALAAASDTSLREIAVPWSQTEEFWGSADPAELATLLQDLAGLARRAAAAGQRLYCWVSV